MGMVDNRKVQFGLSALIRYHRRKIEKFEPFSEKLLLAELVYNGSMLESPAEL